jgi:hypothetical protein
MQNQATSIDCDGPVMLKQIFENTFATTTPTKFPTKTELLSLDLRNSKHNSITFHGDVREKFVSFEAVGHKTANIVFIVSPRAPPMRAPVCVHPSSHVL